MVKVIYPDIQPGVRATNEKATIFCIARKKWVKLTPEEWVRQNFLLYLTKSLDYPLSLIAVEKKVLIGEASQRFDIVVFDRNGKPFILIECKEMEHSLNNKTALFQVIRYNRMLSAPFFCITNGSHTYLFQIIEAEVENCNSFPILD